MSDTIKYFRSPNGKFDVRVPNITYQTCNSEALEILQDPEISLDDTVGIKPQQNNNQNSSNGINSA